MLRQLADLRPGEAPRVLFAGVWCACLLTANYGLHPLREAMGVAGGVDKLHWLFTATFVATLLAVPLFGFAVARLGRARLVGWVHRFLAANALAFFASMQGWLGDSPDLAVWTARVFFVWTSVFNLFAVSLFWSVMADLFTGPDAKRLFGVISVGGSIGALLGPLIGGALAVWADPSLLLILVALLLEVSLGCSRRVAIADSPLPAIGGSPFAGIVELIRSPALLGIAGYVLLLTISSTVAYFGQAQIVAREFADPDDQTAVFAGIDFAVNALTLVIQGLIAGRLMRRAGLGVALAILPAITLVGLLWLAVAPVLATRSAGHSACLPVRDRQAGPRGVVHRRRPIRPLQGQEHDRHCGLSRWRCVERLGVRRPSRVGPRSRRHCAGVRPARAGVDRRRSRARAPLSSRSGYRGWERSVAR